jgi:uncharacterized protein
MLLEIRELEAHAVDFDEQIAPGVIDFGLEVRQSGKLAASGRAQLVREHHGKHKLINDIRVAGGFSTKMELLCARCLEPISCEVAKKFDLLYRPQGSDAGKEELSVTAAEADIGYYQGEGLLLEDALKEQVLLALPAKQVCSEDCKGLCPHCGRNLNTESCDCAGAIPDPRWTALEDIRKKLER